MNMSLEIKKYCSIARKRVSVNGEVAFRWDGEEAYGKFIRGVYRHFQTGYAKFFKMDPLSKLGFISVEVLLHGEEITAPVEKSGIILSNGSSSLQVDETHYNSIRERENYFPSPSNFVYTLPNIMAGEAAIRHSFRGENSVLISRAFDAELIHSIGSLAFATDSVQLLVCGWVEQYGNNYESLLFLIEEAGAGKDISKEGIIFEPSKLTDLYKQEIEWKN